MLPNISIQKAQLIKQKLEEIKNTLDQDIISHSSNGVNIEISVLGNIKKISNPLNKNLEEIIFCFDQDDAGEKAVKKYAEDLRVMSLKTYFN